MTDGFPEPARGKRLNLRPGLIGTAVALLVSASVSIWGWIHIPENARIPTHWDSSGTADGFSGKTPVLIELPLGMIALSGLFIGLTFIVPREETTSKALAYTASWLGTLLLLVGIHTAVIINAAGGEIPVARVVVTGVGVLYLLFGAYMPKTRETPAVDVPGRRAGQDTRAMDISGRRAGQGTQARHIPSRTEQEERVSRRAHRLGGRLFAVLGLFLLTFGFVLPVPVLTVTLLVGTVAISVTLLLHSWWSFDARRS